MNGTMTNGNTSLNHEERVKKFIHKYEKDLSKEYKNLHDKIQPTKINILDQS